MAEPTLIRSPSGTAFPPTLRSAEIIRRNHGSPEIPKTTAMTAQAPNSTGRRRLFTESPGASTAAGTRRGTQKNQDAQETQSEQATHGNQNGTQNGTQKTQNTGTNTGTGTGTHGTPKAFQRPAFLQTAGPSNKINMDDIIELTVGTFRCPAALMNKDKNVASFLDRVVWTTEKHKAIGEALQANSHSQDLKKQIGDHFCAFGTRNECESERVTNDAAAAATIMAIAGLSPANKVIVEKALLYGVGLNLDQLQGAAQNVEDGEQLGDRTAETGDLENVHLMGLLELVTAVICQVDCEAGGVALSIQNLFRMDFAECTRVVDALAIERRTWESAYRELGEAPLANYIRMENFKTNMGACEQFTAVVQEFGFITAHRQEIKLSRIKDWGTVEKLFIEASVIVGRKEAADRQIGDDSSIGSSMSDQKISAHPSHMVDPTEHRGIVKKKTGADIRKETQAREVADKVADLKLNGEDIGLNCRDCKEEFIYSTHEQIRFLERGWENLPTRCRTCRDKDLKKNPRPCFDFEAGNCRRGDTCKFSHTGSVTSAHHTQMSEQEKYYSESEEYSSDGGYYYDSDSE